MLRKVIAVLSVTALSLTMAITAGSISANADAKPGQSMTHMKTAAGLTATLESAGVILYVQGGATAGVIGDSISAPNGQMVFHIPITNAKSPVLHVGSNIVFFNTANNSQVTLRNPVIDLSKGVVTATVPQASNASVTILNITNAADLKAKVTSNRATKLRSTTYAGAALTLAPGVGATLATLLSLPAGSLPDGIVFGTADVTINRALGKR